MGSAAFCGTEGRTEADRRLVVSRNDSSDALIWWFIALIFFLTVIAS